MRQYTGAGRSVRILIAAFFVVAATSGAAMVAHSWATDEVQRSLDLMASQAMTLNVSKSDQGSAMPDASNVAEGAMRLLRAGENMAAAETGLVVAGAALAALAVALVPAFLISEAIWSGAGSLWKATRTRIRAAPTVTCRQQRGS